MEKLTYRQAYDKIIEAYFRGEIQPWEPKFCFCGTLCGGSNKWCIDSYHGIHNNFGNYTGSEYAEMERALLNPIGNAGSNDREYEEVLFIGMSAALSVLKQIHIGRGENVDEDIPAFTKRELVKVH